MVKRVILDRELAAIYGVSTRRLNEQSSSTPNASPEDFMFQLSPEEAELSMLQFATLKQTSVPEQGSFCS